MKTISFVPHAGISATSGLIAETPQTKLTRLQEEFTRISNGGAFAEKVRILLAICEIDPTTRKEVEDNAGFHPLCSQVNQQLKRSQPTLSTGVST